MTTTPLATGCHLWVPHNRWDLATDIVLRPRTDTVAVIVPYYEQPESLLRMYEALAAATIDRHQIELIVIDDGSAVPPPPPPPSFEIATRVVRQPNRGFRPGAARNLGAATTTADILVFLDADTLPEPETVARLAAWPAVMPDALVVGRRGHVDLTGWTPEATGRWLTASGPGPRRRSDPSWLQLGYDETDNLLVADDRSYRFVISAVMACHRWLYDDIGGFDATRDEYGGEDWEFASRAFNNGAVLVHDPTAVAWHDEPDWADRDGSSGAKNLETMWLARAITEPSTRGRGLRHAQPDTIVRIALPAGTTIGQFVVTIDSLLTGLPDIGIHLPPDLPEPLWRNVQHDQRVHRSRPANSSLVRARTVIDVDQPLMWEPVALRETVDAVRPNGPGTITIRCSGQQLASVSSTRALGRVRRAAVQGIDPLVAMAHLFGREVRHPAEAGVHPLHGEVDLAGSLAGGPS